MLSTGHRPYHENRNIELKSRRRSPTPRWSVPRTRTPCRSCLRRRLRRPPPLLRFRPIQSIPNPGTRASAYRKITQAGGSANSPHNAAIRVDKHADKHVSRQSRSEVQSLMREKLEKLEKLKRIQDESQSSTQIDQSRMKQQRLLAEPLNKAPNIVQNDHVSQVHPVQNNHEKLEKLKRMWHESQSSMQNDQSRMKQPRLPAEKITLPLNEDPYLSIVHDDRVSQVHHVQNNLPPQQCFNKWGQPLLPGRSYFPQQNDLICFNMLYGFRGYAPVASTPVHGYGNNQPLWHQPPPWTQQLSQFEHHKACFNKHNGASYHGYAQQLPAGTHSVYGNNQQQWQSLPPIYNPPASGSWQHPPPVHHPCQPSGVWTS